MELCLTCCCGDVGRPLALPLETTVADSVAVGTGDAPSFCYVSGDGNRSYTGVTAVVLVELLLLLCGVLISVRQIMWRGRFSGYGVGIGAHAQTFRRLSCSHSPKSNLHK